MVFSVTYYSELGKAILFYGLYDFLPSKNDIVL